MTFCAYRRNPIEPFLGTKTHDLLIIPIPVRFVNRGGERIFTMKLLAIDGNSIINRAFFGVRALSTQSGQPTNAIFGFLNILLKLKKDWEPDQIVFTFDRHAPTFRHKQYDQYKANRKGMPQELFCQMQPLKDILAALGYAIVELDGYEADDLLGTLSRLAGEQGGSCVIATGDRDSFQLVSDTTTVCLVKTKEQIAYTPKKIREDYGVAPKQMIEIKALMGDTSDNIPGVKGIGEKTAVSLIQQFGSLDELYAHLEQAKLTPRVKKLLAEGKENAYLSRELGTICLTAPVEQDLSAYAQKPENREELYRLLTGLELFSMLPKFGLEQGEYTAAPAEMTNRIEYTLAAPESLEEAKQDLAGLETVDYLLTDSGLLVMGKSTVYSFALTASQAFEALVLDSDKPKRTFKAKPSYKLARSLGKPLDTVWDGELAAYLLSVSSKGYEIGQLAVKYLPQLEFVGPEQGREMAILPHLCPALEKLVREQQMEFLLTHIELPLCRVLAQMEQDGFGVDAKALEEYGKELSAQAEELKAKLFDYAGHEFNPNSTKELGKVLFDPNELGLPPLKKTKTGYSTSAEVLERLRGNHPIIQTLLDYRKLTKLTSTYTTGLLKVIGQDGRVHSTFNQTETRTGRISSTEPNVQNIPVRTPQGSRLREFFVPREGWVLVDADYSQIELRLLAHIADDQHMLQAFRDGEDIHRRTASQVLGIPASQITPQQRSSAKAINFGIVYGISAFSLSQDIHVSVPQAKAYIDAYLANFSGVAKYMTDIVEFAKEHGYVETLYHRRRELGDIRSSNHNVREGAKRIALNTPIQGTAADIIKLAMVRVHRRLEQEGLQARLILQVHDELIVECPPQEEESVKKLLKEEMEHAADLKVKLEVDVHSGKNWLAAKG